MGVVKCTGLSTELIIIYFFTWYVLLCLSALAYMFQSITLNKGVFNFITKVHTVVF